MYLYKLIRMKMIVGYEAWSRHIKPVALFQQAILKTLVDMIKLSAVVVHRSLPKDKNTGLSVFTKNDLKNEIKSYRINYKFSDNLSKESAKHLE